MIPLEPIPEMYETIWIILSFNFAAMVVVLYLIWILFDRVKKLETNLGL